MVCRSNTRTNETFVRFGMDSVHAMMLVGDLEEHLDRRLPPTLAWTYPTVRTLAAHLAETSPELASGDDALLDRLDDMSEEEIDALLAERRAATTPPAA